MVFYNEVNELMDVSGLFISISSLTFAFT